MIILMLGAQGTGKGTVAGLLEKSLGCIQLSTGDVFRKNIQEQTPLGIEANKYIANGNLVPDEVTVPMVMEMLNSKEAEAGVILDGFPRTINQAEKLDEILAKQGKKVDLVINLTTPRDEIVERILTRRVCSNAKCKTIYNTIMHPPKQEGICDKCGSPIVQREDDSDEEAIKKRLAIYDEQTSPLVEYYTKQGVVRKEEISNRINRMADTVAKEITDDIKENF